MTSKVGYQVHSKMTYGRNWSADEDSYFQAHLSRLNPSAMLFLDDDGKALQTKAKFPDCAVVGRLYRADIPEGELWLKRSPQQVFDDYKNTPKGIIRNILNEPSGFGDLRGLALWCSQVMDLFGNAGVPIATPNFGEGHPDVDRLPELEPLWAAFDKWHDLHYYGTHEYGTYRGMLFNEAGKWDVFPWRIGRFETFIVPYLQRTGHKVPKVILTEFGIDSAHDGTDKRGWKTAWDEIRYAGEITAAIDRVYKAPHYVGLCLFSWGNTGQKDTESDWISFDVSGAKALHQRLEQMTAPPVTPFDYGDLIPSILEITNSKISTINLRAMPSTDSAILLQIPDGAKVDYSQNAPNSGDFKWHKVIYNGVTGFMAETANYQVTRVFTPANSPKFAVGQTVTVNEWQPYGEILAIRNYENISGQWEYQIAYTDDNGGGRKGWFSEPLLIPELSPVETRHTVTIRIPGLTLEQAQALINNVIVQIEEEI